MLRNLMPEILSIPAITMVFGALFVACMIAAAAHDLVSFSIPNFLSLVLLAGFAAFGVTLGVSWGVLGLHASAGLVLLAVGWFLFALGLIGGGDAKFMAASGVWAGWLDLLDYVVAFILCGGLLSLLLLLFRWLPLPAGLMRITWIAALHKPENGVPYGVALAAGAIIAMPNMAIFSKLAVDSG